MSMINYIGIDNVDSDLFNCYFPFSIDGTVKINDSINDILSFSATNEIKNYNFIKTFELSNLENFQVYSNLAYINTKFSLIFEYGADNCYNINAFENCFFKSFVMPIHDCLYDNIDVYLLIKDLYCNKLSEDTLFYSIHVNIAINNKC